MDPKSDQTQKGIREFHPNLVPKPPGLASFDWKQTKDYIALEIGCGNGMHPVQWALKNPDKTLIAIEQTQNKFKAFQKRLQNYDHLQNIFAIRADAIWWCAHNLSPTNILDEIFLLYPNPYPKSSQANKRFHNMPFMGFLLQHLKPGGRLTLATNIDDYANEAKRQYVSEWDLTLSQDSQVPVTAAPRTAFEKKYLNRDEVCTNLVFLK